MLVFLTLLNIFLLSKVNFSSAKSSNLSVFAAEVISKCANNTYPSACYDEEIPHLMDKISMEDAFKVTALVQAKDPGYLYCHAVGHRLSKLEIDKDSSKWKEVIARCPTNQCNNGCLHGAVQTHFQAESLPNSKIISLLPDLSDICKSLSIDERSSCSHGMGHLLMYLSNGNVNSSLGFCDQFPPINGSIYLLGCYDGVFMQTFQKGSPEDQTLARASNLDISKSNVEAFCNQFKKTAHDACWEGAWYFFQLEMGNASYLLSYCAKVSTEENGRCIDETIAHLATAFNYDLDKIRTFCSGFTGKFSGTCLTSAASHTLNLGEPRAISRAIEICQIIQDPASAETCTDNLVSVAKTYFGPEAVPTKTLCGSLPPAWSKKCSS